MLLFFQDPFGEKRGHFDYQSILKRLETIRNTLSEKQDKSSDEEYSESDNDTNSANS